MKCECTEQMFCKVTSSYQYVLLTLYIQVSNVSGRKTYSVSIVHWLLKLFYIIGIADWWISMRELLEIIWYFCHHQKRLCVREQWYSGTVVQWYSGKVVQWYNGTVVQWYSGTVVQWYNGTVVHWYNGSVVKWYNGTLVQW